MKLTIPNKAYGVEWQPDNDGKVLYYEKPEDQWDIRVKSKSFKLPRWVNEMIIRERDEAYQQGSNNARKKVRDLITQLKNL